MALPTSGLISANNIRTELGIPSQAPFSITSAATGGYVTINQSSPSKPNSTTPHAISEWYGYNHSTSIPLYFNLINDNLYSCTATINSNQILTLINNGSTNTQLNNNDYFYVTYKNDSLNEQQIRIIINSSIRGELLNMLTFISSKEHVRWTDIQAKSGESLTVSITVYTW